MKKRRFVDLSIYLENDVISDPAPFGPKIQYHKHENTAAQIAGFFPGLKKEDLPDGAGWAVENVNLSTHNGTHLDAPYHFHPTMNKGERAITIDEVPLDWCFQPGVKLDFRAMEDGHVITAKEVEDELKRIGHELQPLEIVVVNTRAGSRYGNDDYVNSGCGMGYDATMYLLEKGIRLTGTDAWSWDAPFYFTAQKWAKDHDPSIIWEGHKAGRDIGYCHIEKLHNLESLPGDGFIISCFPHKIRGASAGWTRAVAIFEEWRQRLSRELPDCSVFVRQVPMSALESRALERDMEANRLEDYLDIATQHHGRSRTGLARPRWHHRSMLRVDRDASFVSHADECAAAGRERQRAVEEAAVMAQSVAARIDSRRAARSRYRG